MTIIELQTLVAQAAAKPSRRYFSLTAAQGTALLKDIADHRLTATEIALRDQVANLQQQLARALQPARKA
jgi:hypothetical protein